MLEKCFESRDAASIAVAAEAAAAIRRRLEAQGNASVVVSGGTSPQRCLIELSATDLDWSQVHVIPSDERWVAATSEDSNENMIRSTLLRGKASGAILHGLYQETSSVEERCAEVGSEFKSLPFPFAFSLLGMGADGHFASLFPDADNLEAGLNPDSTTLCVPIRTAASPHQRISLSLSALSRSDEIALLIFGEDKWETLQAAKSSPAAYPVSRLLTQKRAPVTVYWAA